MLYSPYSLTIIKERYRWKTQIHFKVCVILITKNRYIFVINLSVSTCFLRSALNQTTKLNLTAILTSRLNKLVASKQTFLNHKHPHLSVVKLLKNSWLGSQSLPLCRNEERIIQSFFSPSTLINKTFLISINL